MNNSDNQEYLGKIIRTSDGQLGRVIRDDKEYNSDKILVVLQDQNSRNLINKYKNTGVKIETKKNLVTILDQTQEINKILDERLAKAIKQPITIEKTNSISYKGLTLKPNMNKIMQIIFQFVAQKNYDEFCSLLTMRKDIKNEFIQEFEKKLGIQINSENCYQFIRLLNSISSGGTAKGNLSFFNKDIYLYSKDDEKNIEGENKDYAPKNNLNSFVEELCIYINLKHNTKRKKREFKHDPTNPELYNRKPDVLKDTGRSYGLLFE